MAEATPSINGDAWKSSNFLSHVQDVDVLRQEAIDAQHAHLITEIETSEVPLATTLR